MKIEVESEAIDTLKAMAHRLQDDLDEAVAFLAAYRNCVPLGHQPHMMAQEVDSFLERIGA